MDDGHLRDARHRTPPPPAGGELPAGRRLALVVGIDAYGYRILPPLRHAVKDAEAMAAKLRDVFGFEVTLLADREAQAEAIRGVLGRWQAETRPEDRVLVFFAGYGASQPGPGGQAEGFLLPFDATGDPTSWLPQTGLAQMARGLAARSVFLVFDACFAGMAFQRQPAAADTGQIVLALVAGTSEQPVLDGGAGDHSVFTRAVLDGLDGWADSGQRPDDQISADELIAYVGAEVPWRTRLRGHVQTPLGGPLWGSGKGGGFLFRPVVPRLPAPLLRNIYSRIADDRVAAARQLGVKAPADRPGLLELKAGELVRLLDDSSEALPVRVAAAQALGTLGHPLGCTPLAKALGGEAGELRAAAALALGRLGASLGDTEPQAGGAIQALILALGDPDPGALEAAKHGLAGMPGAAMALQSALQTAARPQRYQVADALACLADWPLEGGGDWPAISRVDARLLRRFCLARRRLRPQGPAVRRQALVVGLSGALGLSLGYLLAILGLWPLNPYGPAVFSYNLLPGALAGVSLAVVPRLAHACSRRPGLGTRAGGGLLAGLLLGLGLALPNWFLAVGRGPVAWVAPGLLSGALLGLTLVLLPPARPDRPEAATPAGMEWQDVAAVAVAAAVGALTFALSRLPGGLAWSMAPGPGGMLRLACAGAVFAAALAVGWRA